MAQRHYFLGTYLHQADTRRPCAAIVTLSTVTDFAALTPEAREFADWCAQLAVGWGATDCADLLSIEGLPDEETFRGALAKISKKLGEVVQVERVVNVGARDGL